MSATVHQDIATMLMRQGMVLTGVTTDSRRVRPGMVFAAYPGEAGDGRNYIAAAISAGAAAVLWEQSNFDWPSEFGTTVNLPVANLRDAVGEIAAQIYGDPSRDMWIVGVTGTNGKTSCTQWLAQAFTAQSRKTAVIGTLGNGFLPDLDYTGNTTPDAAVVQASLAAYRNAGATGAAIEVSSHGLDQGRVNGVQFDVAVLTNLTRDHLDYHGDMASYAAAKARLFAWPGLRYAVLNLDDEFGRELAGVRQLNAAQVIGYGCERGNVRCVRLQLSPAGLVMNIDSDWGSAELHSALLGRFNAHNLLASLATLLASGIGLGDAVATLSTVTAVAGRMQAIGGNTQPLVIIDYAHTPDALEKVLLSLRELNPAGRLWCVFGCGGERDAGKRPLMGAIAARLADSAMVTSDNPRSEDAQAIINEIRTGMNGNELATTDRAQAIAEVVAQAQAGDMVLIAGKGHEAYQEIAGIKYPFDDLAVARQALEARV
ncbi:MAG: UDP-N-acetylmuramoyl-L-alanyl-D-glutamate--2,6-diaminopimelate ligase [Sulfuriferula sp.]|nr:UDP-N-acetylmuramoyl-L-alanyl-D-glutamate--2,6-diaminopimelate ligase [Sulfuriferula sp.]